METVQETSYACETHEQENNLIDLKEFRRLVVLYNQFYYVIDVANFSNIYVSANVKKMLGYEPDDFLNISFVYKAIHPDDREFVHELSQKTLRMSREYSEILKINPYAAVFSIDFRMRCKNGNYIRVNRQSCCCKTDQSGNMVYALSLFTDINHIKRDNLITYAWKSDYPLDFSEEDLTFRFQQSILTPREVEIITYLSCGLSAAQIACKLFISENTVIKHRKNILHKTKVKNTAELVKYALEMGII